MKKQFFFFILFNFITHINGQYINLNQSSIIENIRDQQLIGNISSDLSFSLKPISLENFDSEEIEILQLENYASSFLKSLNGKIDFKILIRDRTLISKSCLNASILNPLKGLKLILPGK